MDAAEIVDHRHKATIGYYTPAACAAILDLLAALEQARKERDDLDRTSERELAACERERDALAKRLEDMRIANVGMEAQRDAAHQDAKDARALLAEAKPCVPNLSFSMSRELAARIEAMLEQKP